LTYLWHGELALESASDPVINALGFPPCLFDALVAVGLVTPALVGCKSLILTANGRSRYALEWLGAFFDDWRLYRHDKLYEEHVRTTDSAMNNARACEIDGRLWLARCHPTEKPLIHPKRLCRVC
jgi:hypothetical protein